MKGELQLVLSERLYSSLFVFIVGFFHLISLCFPLLVHFLSLFTDILCGIDICVCDIN
jgi:hypothetical protein